MLKFKVGMWHPYLTSERSIDLSCWLLLSILCKMFIFFFFFLPEVQAVIIGVYREMALLCFPHRNFSWFLTPRIFGRRCLFFSKGNVPSLVPYCLAAVTASSPCTSWDLNLNLLPEPGMGLPPGCRTCYFYRTSLCLEDFHFRMIPLLTSAAGLHLGRLSAWL